MARFSRKISSWLGKDDVMNGVIIWSEHISKRAIIWCEDHGCLAFFKAEKTLQGELFRKNQVFAYESGDMVSFTVDEQADFAARPRFTMGQPSEISASCRAIESGVFFCRRGCAPLWEHCSIQMR